MGESKHTPGPWTVGILTPTDDPHLVTADDGSKYHRRRTVATIPDGSYRDDDAHLIAAAPQMLEALRAAEWRGPRAFAHASSGPTCPWCGQPKPPKNHLASGHASDCAWLSAIKAATGGET